MKDQGPDFLEIRLNLTTITGMTLQCSYSSENDGFVTSFSVSYSLDGSTWRDYTVKGKIKVRQAVFCLDLEIEHHVHCL